ncbi:MAG TPA: FKBP-type peptidyl-prolyl cis-trans isomerase, partial [Solirubrobacteraceae bacterium]|nr:FKBP-type peptidyl-prolyl cis-trans isomerase [Solirubrobacteraceae bacterium]
MPRRLAIASALVCLATAALGCGSKHKTASQPAAATPPATTPTATTPTTTTKAPSKKAGAGGSPKDTSVKPKIAKPSGATPKKLVSKDIVTGKGPAAKAGDTVTVQYVGVSFKTGKQFDASWDRGQPFDFQLGAGMVIPGWDKGVKGMRIGGRRELIIPS